MSTGLAATLNILSKNRRLLYLGAAVSLLGHVAILSVYLGPREKIEEVVVAHIEWEEEETPFFIPPPQLAREFAFRRQPVAEGTPVIRSSGDRTTTTVSGGGGANLRMGGSRMKWSRQTGVSSDFAVNLAVGTGIGEAVVGLPQFEAVSLKSLKEPENRIDMQAEFLDLTVLNTGKYKGMVVQDPTNKKNVSGFVYLVAAWGSVLEPPYRRAVSQLVRAVNDQTRIEAKVDEQIYLDSQALFKAPFVYISAGRAFELTRQESQNLAAYLRNGGFVVADNAQPQLQYGPAEASLRNMFKQALGRDARFVPIRDNHPLYHVFYDFDSGPPPGGEATGFRPSATTGKTDPVYWLEGIFLEDRLVAVYSDKGYGAFWERETENEAHLRLGVNLVVFALTQKGSIAQQQIDFYNQGAASGG